MTFKVTIFCLLAVGLTACGSCDDPAGVPRSDMDAPDVPGLQLPDLDIPDLDMGEGDMVVDLSESDMVEDQSDDVGDMAPDVPEVGPRAPLEFVSAHLVKEFGTNARAVSDGKGGWFAAGSSIGRDVVFEPGLTTEVVIDATVPNEFRSIFAHWDASGELLEAFPFTSYAGGPAAGGTSTTAAIAAETSGDALVAGTFGGSVRFSNNTVWSTQQGAISTATEGYVVRVNPGTNGLQNLVRISTNTPTGLINTTALVVHETSGDFTLGGRATGNAEFPGTTLTGSGGFLARFQDDGTLRWALKLGFQISSIRAFDDESALVEFTYDESGFELDGTTYAGVAAGERGYTLARINSDASLAWMIRTEGQLFSRVFWDNALDADGTLWVATSPGPTQFVDVPNAPAISENTRLLALNSSTGEVLLADELSVIPEAANKVNVLERDESGILWTYVSYGGSQSPSTQDYEVTPTYGPVLNLPSGGNYGVLLGLDTSDFSIAYAYLASDQGHWMASHSTPLQDGMLFYNTFFNDLRIAPNSATPPTYSNEQAGSPDTVFLRVR